MSDDLMKMVKAVLYARSVSKVKKKTLRIKSPSEHYIKMNDEMTNDLKNIIEYLLDTFERSSNV